MFITQNIKQQICWQYTESFILNDKNIFTPYTLFNKTYFNYFYIIHWSRNHQNMRRIPAI